MRTETITNSLGVGVVFLRTAHALAQWQRSQPFRNVSTFQCHTMEMSMTTQKKEEQNDGGRERESARDSALLILV